MITVAFGAADAPYLGQRLRQENLIEALQLLSWIAQGNTLGSIRHAVREWRHVKRFRDQTCKALAGEAPGLVDLSIIKRLKKKSVSPRFR